MMDKLKKRWGISSNFQILKIFIVFGITGSTAAWISEPLCDIFGITMDIFFQESSPCSIKCNKP